jgi:hypothetical protein
MPRARHHRSRRATFHLTGDRAEALADRLLMGRSDVLDLVWDELAARAGRATRVRHDWDPLTRTFTLEA